MFYSWTLDWEPLKRMVLKGSLQFWKWSAGQKTFECGHWQPQRPILTKLWVRAWLLHPKGLRHARQTATSSWSGTEQQPHPDPVQNLCPGLPLPPTPPLPKWKIKERQHLPVIRKWNDQPPHLVTLRLGGEKSKFLIRSRESEQAASVSRGVLLPAHSPAQTGPTNPPGDKEPKPTAIPREQGTCTSFCLLNLPHPPSRSLVRVAKSLLPRLLTSVAWSLPDFSRFCSDKETGRACS